MPANTSNALYSLLLRSHSSPSVIEPVGRNEHPNKKQERPVKSEVVVGIVADDVNRAVDEVYHRRSSLAIGVLYDSGA